MINTLAPSGHVRFDQEILKCLHELGSVTFAAPPGYLDDSAADHRVDIKTANIHSGSRIGSRWAQVKALGEVLKTLNPERYDAVIFLAYELTSFALRWPSSIPAILFEHNNVDEICNSGLKRYVFKRFVKNKKHVTYEQYIVNLLNEEFGKNAFHVPHPVTMSVPVSSDAVQKRADGAPLKIFSPSQRTPADVQRELVDLVIANPGEYSVLARGSEYETGADYILQPYFENFDAELADADVCVIGGDYGYRVSAIAYQVLSIGRPVVMFNSLFAKELLSQFPGQVYLIGSVSELSNLRSKLQRSVPASQEFVETHSFETVKRALAKVVGVKGG